MPLLDQLRETELALLNAPFEAGGWTRAIDMVASATGGAGANLVGLGGPLALSLNLFTGREEALADRYFARPELWGACNWRVNCSARPLSVQHDSHYAAYRQTVDTSDYDDAVADLDMQFGCQSVLVSDSRTFLGLAVFRGRREGLCDVSALERFRALLRPLHRALRLQMALSGEAAELMVGDLSALDSAVVLIDRHGCLCALSPAAERLVEPDGPIRLSGLMFELCDGADNRRMQSALARLLSSEGADDSSWVQEMRVVHAAAADLHDGWVARAFRLPQREHGLGFNPHVAIAFEPWQP